MVSSSSSLLSPSSYTELKDAWHPSTTANTTESSYWFNWRVMICCIWMAIATVITAFLIFKYEGFRRKRSDVGEVDGGEKEWSGNVYEDETWRPCLRNIHPAWLLAFRVVAFFVLLVMLIVIGLVDGPTIFFYYTQWTFGLITLYFGLGSLLSLHGCYQYNKRAAGDRVDSIEAIDSERARSKGADNTIQQSQYSSNPAGFWGYVFQIIFQMNAGAVLLTDCVFWFIIVPFLEIHDYSLNVLVINMHSLNAIFLLGDAALNSLSFPCFRIAYFFFWTIAYVIFQWALHSLVHIWWPYPFLDLSSHYAPLWYFSVAVMHLPCYGAFALLVKLKHRLLQRWFPESYQSPR
ncbi:hypothetical protein AtNW77_Chr5g0149591 [Arabidopsis thaliana]|jgi:hypothetical protein|uniref:At5g62960 n=7 Tax=Arabidopsis TaxID=3701 RepID=Q6NPD1_ARATH|nr:UDP-N-acetylglucosamine-N-acetylmuramyl-pyrophosphoryl-undecaprenol N-acetylglucosamine protein [Arabidopsis thaliana]KAG7607076.1 hypothetical protein ISN45_At05g059100 [Arabidopsis thaliana x Arabidopsis arenosa]KAG7613990.1 hypothetical protein ISN44_As05g058320 [Arabidopsis suecica]AAR24234.1 At5g62960 [Arabidopsis thaliana]AAR24772.1 At5g62960 [Arabidopsis thaliana]AED97680.1 UDP-N-acetylglucosamine-N-acetylmuramyl-pyrophosphoryl-undecaprenol N-acetylglucosamine protein [Arabidopsis th|eukprot:NP_201101.2 UDP-N-acetylglucosamine-N-acetylmuramyl-pyrophosphoryl-undecaprenol N-acetylglucosamine protein [Arabidopsis thaliana]